MGTPANRLTRLCKRKSTHTDTQLFSLFDFTQKSLILDGADGKVFYYITFIVICVFNCKAFDWIRQRDLFRGFIPLFILKNLKKLICYQYVSIENARWVLCLIWLLTKSTCNFPPKIVARELSFHLWKWHTHWCRTSQSTELKHCVVSRIFEHNFIRAKLSK